MNHTTVDELHNGWWTAPAHVREQNSNKPGN